jgi:predicted dehydrogenase
MDRVRLGFVGLGLRGSGQAERVDSGFSERAEIVALADLDPARMSRCLARLTHSAPVSYTDWRRLLDRGDVDAVCISTPQDTHCEIAVAAFQAGKHVYCEKPLALTLVECDAMIEAAERAGKVFLVGQQMRYHLHLNRLSALIEEGEIGTPHMAWLKEFRNPFPRTMRWAFDKAKSGGALVEKSCHHFDVFAWLLRAPPVRVFASGGQAVHDEIFGVPSSVADHAWVTVEHEGGTKSMLGLCFFAGRPDVREGGVGTHVRDIGVIGDRGMILTEGFHLGRNLEIHYADRPDVVRVDLDPARGRRDALGERDGNWGIWVDFLNCVQQGGQPVASAQLGRQSLAVALAAERSLETGAPVLIGKVD